MAKKLDPKLIDIFKRYDMDASECLWDCHGTWVAYHKSIEEIGAKAGVSFSRPEVVETNHEKAHVAIIAYGKLNDREEWSFGECSPKNNKNAYPFAMAEKRAKDRVILKLVGLHGFVYSEEESDDFKPNAAPKKSSASLKKEGVLEELQNEILDCKSVITLNKLRADYRERARTEGWNRQFSEGLADIFENHEKELEQA